MTKDEAMKLALDYLKDHQMGNHVRTALEEALAKQEQDEPVAEVFQDGPNAEAIRFLPAGLSLKVGDKLYTTPQPAQKPWVGLTDYEIGVCSAEAAMNRNEMVGGAVTFARAIEAKLKQKNGIKG